MTGLDDIAGALFGDDPGDVNPQREQFSTGANPVSVDTEWREFDFGFTARSVSVRADGPVVVSFDRPWQHPQSHIRLRDEDLPFSIGGETPIAESSVYVKARGADGGVNVEILAL